MFLHYLVRYIIYNMCIVHTFITEIIANYLDILDIYIIKTATMVI